MEDDNDSWSVVPSRDRENKLIKDQRKSDSADKNRNKRQTTKTLAIIPRPEQGQSSTLQEFNDSNEKKDVGDECLIGSFVYQNTDKPSIVTDSRPNGLPTRRPLNSTAEQATPTIIGYNDEHTTRTSDLRNRHTSDRDLIGAPIVIPGNHDYQVDLHPSPLFVRDTSGAEGAGDLPGVDVARRERGLLRLRPGMLGPSVKDNNKPLQPDFSLTSPGDWPTILTTSPGQLSDEAVDLKTWSTVVKTVPPPMPPRKKSSNDELRSSAESSTDNEKEGTSKQRKKKKKKKKKGSGQKTASEREKPRDQPLMLELGALFESLQVQSSSKKVVVSTGVGVAIRHSSVVPQKVATPMKSDKKVIPRAGNTLDSTAPQTRKGKEREKPKKRKPTPLRRIIDKEKEERKKEREGNPIVEEVHNLEVETIKNEIEVNMTVSELENECDTNSDSQIEATKKETDTENHVAVTTDTENNVEAANNETNPENHVEATMKETETQNQVEATKKETETQNQVEATKKETETQNHVEATMKETKTQNHVEATKKEIAEESNTCANVTNPVKSTKKKSRAHKKATPTIKPKPTIHNRSFREYCSHIITEDINSCVELLLSELLRFQDRQYLKDPIKAKIKKRYVCGMREVLKHLKSGRIKCLLVAPNMDRIQSEGGINDVIGQILCLAKEQGIPIVFATSRRRLALTLKKSHKVGCVGVFSYGGAEGHYKRLMELVEEAKDEYQRRSATHLQTETRGLKIESSPNGEAIAPPSQRDEQDLLNAGCDDESDTSDSAVGNETDCSGDLRSTPWSIFFTQNTSSTGNSPRPLITGASPKPSSEGIAPKPSITGATTELTKEGNSPKYLTNFPHGHSLTTQLKEERGRPKFGRHARALQEPSVHFSSVTNHTPHTNDSSLLQLPPTVQSTNISPYGRLLHHVTRVEGQPRHVDGQPTNFNISATEFVPSWTLNIHAQEFTPSVATET